MLQSDATRRRLDVINRVPGFAVHDHIAVPQLVVCGNPSVGKSSVLESIAGIPLRSEGATRFPIEISIRHAADSDQRVTASIRPHYSRDAATAENLRRYSRILSGQGEIPDVIAEVAGILQLKGFTEHENGVTYAADILRIDIIGDTGIHLKLVDAPALISRTDDEVRFAKEILESYLENPASTVLVVLPADRDVENGNIIQLATRYDPLAQRTVGVVTKPDLIPDESSALKVAQLLRNKGTTKLEHGFFMLQNSASEDFLRRGSSSLDRGEADTTYLQNSFWSKIQADPSRTGVYSLQAYLRSLLEAHFNKELPKVTLKIMQQLHDTRQRFEELGAERNSVRDQRLFLSEASTKFTQFVHSALHGMYWDIDFFSDPKDGSPNNRLREQIQNLNRSFLHYMLEQSHAVKVREPEQGKGKPDQGKKKPNNPQSEKHPQHRAPISNTMSSNASHTSSRSAGSASNHAAGGGSHLAPLGGPQMVSLDEFNDWMLGIYRKVKKTSELRGNQTHEVLPEMFRAQSYRWRTIAEQHTKFAHKMVSDFVTRVLECIVQEDSVRAEIQGLIAPELRQNLSAALEELGKILNDNKVEPPTHEYYIAERERLAKEGPSMKSAFKKVLSPSGTKYDPASEERARAVAALQPEFQAEWDDRVAAGGHALALVDYYKAATNTFVDNVCRQAIERHLVQKLGDVFNISTVLKLTDEDVERIAAEPQSKRETKTSLTHIESVLAGALDDLHTY